MMNLRRIWQLVVVALGVAGFAAGSLFASPITFNFNSAGVNAASSGTSVTFTMDGLSIIAYGYQGTTHTKLYQKDTGTTEDGLGLDKAGSWDYEINPKVGTTKAQAIIFDVTNLVHAGITGGTFALGSLQYHSATDVESADACVLDSNSPSYTGTGCSVVLGNSTSIGSIDVTWGSSDFVEFITDPSQTDPTGNYLVDTLKVDTTPEPPSLILFGTMLLGLALVGRRHLAGLLS